MNCLRRHTCWQGKRLYWEPRRTAPLHGLQSWVLWWWDSFPGCLWPTILTQTLSWRYSNCSSQDGFHMEHGGLWRARRISQILPGGSSLLVRCSLPGPHRVTYANGYYGAWPGWAVFVFPLTTPCWETSVPTQDTSWELEQRLLL